MQTVMVNSLHIRPCPLSGRGQYMVLQALHHALLAALSLASFFGGASLPAAGSGYFGLRSRFGLCQYPQELAKTKPCVSLALVTDCSSVANATH